MLELMNQSSIKVHVSTHPLNILSDRKLVLDGFDDGVGEFVRLLLTFRRFGVNADDVLSSGRPDKSARSGREARQDQVDSLLKAGWRRHS